jgi:transcriptional regulator with XRE-family HTH domain
MATSSKQAGKHIARLRTDKGWTHDDMSDVIFETYGVKYATSSRTIQRVEDGHKPTVRKQFAIAMVLGTTPSKLWGGGSASPTPLEEAFA